MWDVNRRAFLGGIFGGSLGLLGTNYLVGKYDIGNSVEAMLNEWGISTVSASNFGHRVLDIEREYLGVEKVPDSCYDALDKIIIGSIKNIRYVESHWDDYKEDIEEKSRIPLYVIGNVLWRDTRLESEGVYLLSEGLISAKPTRDCDISSMIYMSVLDELGLSKNCSFVLVHPPAHTLLSYKDEKKDIYWESTGGFIENEIKERYIKILPKNADFHAAYFAIATYLLEKGECEPALDAVDKALGLYDAYPLTWCLKGIILNYLGKTQESLDSIDFALKLDEMCEDALHYRPIVQYNLDRENSKNPIFID
ncbi:MAG: hypothetical protein ABIG84_05720 [archaeon]